MTALKCIQCGKEAEYVINGNSFCGEHLPIPAQGIITKNEQKPAPFIQPESLLEPKKEDIHTTESVPLVPAEAKEASEQKPVQLLQQPGSPLESKKEDIHAQASPAPLTAEAKAGKTEIPTKTNWSHYLIRTPIKDHWNYYLIIALLIISVIFFTLYLISPK